MEIRGYSILQELGEGGMAKIYLATQNGLDREVALKLVQASKDTEHLMERFANEARLIARLDHVNIITIFDVGETHEGSMFYAMPYLPQGHLRQQKLDSDEAIIRTFEQICSGLSHAHSHQIIHRDLKPENILFDQHGRPQIADFGIAFSVTQATRHTRAGETLGSTHFMSPEQARGNKLDHRSDLYSLGAVLYEVLASRPPFDGPDDISILVAHTSDPIPKLPADRRHWQTLINKALAKSPDQRFQSAEELKIALNKLTQRKRLFAMPAFDFNQHKVMISGLVAAVLVIVLMLGWGGGEPVPIDVHVETDREPQSLAVVNYPTPRINPPMSQATLDRLIADSWIV